jgi:hypothetical protein
VLNHYVYPPIIWRSSGDHLAIIWRSSGDHLAIIWRSSGDHLGAEARLKPLQGR